MKTILISGAGSGFGEAAAIGLARSGHRIIETVQSSPQVTDLRSKVEKLGLQQAIVVEKLDLHGSYDMVMHRLLMSMFSGTMPASAKPGR